MARFPGALAAWLLTATLLSAQGAVPDNRFVVTGDVDFYGSDLDSIFDTDLQTCARACAINPDCRAFTFNGRSNACFPKSAVSDRTPFVGAISAERVPTDPAVLAGADALAARLAFVDEGDLRYAGELTRDIAFENPLSAQTLEDVLAAAQASRGAGDTPGALRWLGMAVAMTDRADLWTEYAWMTLSLPDRGWQDQQRNLRRAQLAALNGYLRGQTGAIRAGALAAMAEGLERQGRHRDMIGVLRVAFDDAPREDIAAALDRAIGLYGFRILDTRVESDAAAPRICADFSEPLVRSGVDYEPFVQMGDAALAVSVDGSTLCLDGVEHGARYRMTFRAGLPAASGEALTKDVTITQYVRDRSPQVRFPGRTYVLPKAADAAIPVETVNLARVELRLRAVSDRNLLRAVQDGYFGRPLSKWEDDAFSADIAREVWTGTGEVRMELNRDVTTRLPLGEVLAGLPTGIYALSARDPNGDEWEGAGAMQWFVLSDLGLTAFAGTDGLHLNVRALSDAGPRDGVTLTLVSRANEVLGTTITDAEGWASFAAGLTRGSGAGAPALVLAEDGTDDLAFLTLTDPAFDLSDRGVEGRALAGPVDVYLTPDRGAYRAGEVIHATALTRDARMLAVDGLPLVATLSRPDGVEHARLVSDGGVAGGHVFAFGLGETVPRGTWTLALRSDPEGPVLAARQVLVEDFLPERIDFTLGLPDAPLRPGDAPPLSVEARYLFGAPGTGLTVEGDVFLRGTRELADWPGYRFGRHDDVPRTRNSYFSGGPTDGNGRAVARIEIPEIDATGVPLTATVVARIAEGSGRPVERRLSVPVQPSGPVIGIRPLFEDVVPEGSDASFQVVALSPDLSARPMQLRWTLNRVETRYQWFQLYGSWDWEAVTRRTRIATGEIAFDGSPLRLDAPVDWGRYELIVEAVGGEPVSASQDFHAGWYAPADSFDTPDTLDLSLDRPGYAPGDTARLRIVPRYAGTALITVLSSEVIARQIVEVTEGENLIPIEVTDAWGAGAYVTASVIRPMDVAAGQNPARSLGLAYAAVSPGDRQLAVTLDAPEVIQPRTTQRVGLRVDGATAGDPVWVTLAAVDLGILNLTGFEAPDPSAHYFGQRRLGVELRDLYGRLIDGMNGAAGIVRSGGDGNAGLRMKAPPPTEKLVAQFTGPVRVAEDGTAWVNLDIPAFNGTVRLMAVAWSPRAVGQASSDMIVRDPVVAQVSRPRFLAPGDTSRMRIELIHAEGPAGAVQIAIDAPGAVTLSARAAETVLTEQGRQTIDLALSSDVIGDHALRLSLTTPGGEVLTRDYVLPVRANDPEIAVTRRFSLGAGETFTLDTAVFADMRPGTGSTLVSAGPLARFDAPGLLTLLNRYPYGCTEQVTSQAMPLLYLSSVAQAAGLGSQGDIDRQVEAAIGQIVARQASNGAFGLWRAESDGDLWLDAYVTDFLGRARVEGHRVPDRVFSMALDNLRNRLNYASDFESGGEDIAYALLVLAREGAASMGDLRYYADERGDAFGSPLAAAQIGAALAAYGDQLRADRMFAQAQRQLDALQGDGMPVWRADYGTRLRDAAGVLTLAAEAGSQAIDRDALTTRVALTDTRRSTQEAAWSLLAAHALIASPGAQGLAVNGVAVDGPFVRLLEDRMTEGLAITTTLEATDLTLTTIGVPVIAPPAGGTGYAIRREHFTLDGERLDASALRVGQRFVTVLTVDPASDLGARLMVDDPLPAGVEIDNPSLLRSGDVRALDWLTLSEARHAEFRSDRFLAVVDLRGRDRVTLAYVARAVSPGAYHHPAASVEDMYRPTQRARTDTGRVTIAE